MRVVSQREDTHEVGRPTLWSRSRRHAWSGAVLFGMLCALLVVSSVSGATNPFADVPKGHWSYAALAEFARLGFIEGYSDDAFGGERVITRYEVAWIVARVSDKLKAPVAGSPASLSLRQRELLVRLQEEFASELALVAGTSRQALPGIGADRSGGEAESAASSGATSTPALAGSLVSLGLPGSSGGPGLPDPTEPAAAVTALPSSLKLRPDLGFIAAISALPGDAGAQAFSGGKRLSELIGAAQDPASEAVASGSQKKALTIPLEDGAKAELSLGGPPVPGGIAPGEGDDVIARLDLKYALSQLAIFRASYELVKDGEKAPDEGEGSAARATALLGIDYNFALSDSAFIKAGYTYSRITDLVPRGVEWGSLGTAEKPKDGASKAAGMFGDYTLPGLSLDARKTTASLGVGYTFGGTASVMLGYRLIDFQEINPESLVPGLHRTNVATAELTIRF